MIYRISSFITSMLPLWVYVIIKYWSYYRDFCFIMLLILIIATLYVIYEFYFFIGKNKKRTLLKLDIINPAPNSNLLTNYLLANVLPMMCLDLTQIDPNTNNIILNMPVIVGGGIVFISLFIFYLDYRIEYCNPLLQLMRYHFYTADMKDANDKTDRNCIVISRNKFHYYENETAYYYKLYNGVYVYVKTYE